MAALGLHLREAREERGVLAADPRLLAIDAVRHPPAAEVGEGVATVRMGHLAAETGDAIGAVAARAPREDGREEAQVAKVALGADLSVAAAAQDALGRAASRLAVEALVVAAPRRAAALGDEARAATAAPVGEALVAPDVAGPGAGPPAEVGPGGAPATLHLHSETAVATGALDPGPEQAAEAHRLAASGGPDAAKALALGLTAVPERGALLDDGVREGPAAALPGVPTIAVHGPAATAAADVVAATPPGVGVPTTVPLDVLGTAAARVEATPET